MQNNDLMNGIRHIYIGIILILLSFSFYDSFGQVIINKELQLSWIQTEPKEGQFQLLSFEGCAYNEYNIPIYATRHQIEESFDYIDLTLTNTKYTTLTSTEIAIFQSLQISSPGKAEVRIYKDRGTAFAYVNIPGIRLNPSSGLPEKLISCTYQINVLAGSPKAFKQKSIQTTADSPLSQGYWFSVGVKKSGIYKISYDDLVELGMNPSTFNPQYLQIYNDGGGMLPHMNLADNWDRFPEIAIYVEGEQDGRFDKGDYILFYGQSVHQIYFP